MAEKSFPLEGTVYTAEDAALWFATRTSGVYASGQLGVTAGDGMSVSVGAGMAWLKYAEYAGVAYANTEQKVLSVSAADANYPRIDRVVIRYSKTENMVYMAVKTGTPATTPVAPSVTRDDGTYEISLARIAVLSNATAIGAESITDERLDGNVCGLMRDGVTGIDTETLEQNVTARLDMFLDERQTAFDAWFAAIQTTLEGDVAASLAAKIVQLNQQMPTEESPLPIARGGTGAGTAQEARNALGITPANIGAVTMKNATANLPVSGWVENKQTVSVAGVTESNSVIVTAGTNNHTKYHECNVRCDGQSNNLLSFSCDETPDSDLTANVLILE